MKKALFNSSILLVLILILAYNINSARGKIFSYFEIEDHLNNLTIINKDFNLFIRSSKRYTNYDEIESKLNKFLIIQNKIHNNQLSHTIHNHDEKLKLSMKTIHDKINEKIVYIRKLKSYKAILNNSFRILNKIHNDNNNNNIELNNILKNILLIDKIESINIQEELKHINSIQIKNKYEKIFIAHSKIILEYYLKINNIQVKISKTNLNKRINDFRLNFKEYSKNKINAAQMLIIILIIIIIILILVYLRYEKKLKLSNKNLLKFKNTLENSESIIMITDKNEKITYVNLAFEKQTKYKQNEILGKSPSILKSSKQDESIFIDVKNTIHSGKTWTGQFINKDKYGKLFYEKATITPSLDDNGKIEEFIYIKLDITKEILIQQDLQHKEQLLFEQSKLSSMGEMIANIAHQWRQPLSIISAGATGIQLQHEFKTLKDDFLIKTCENMNSNAQYLSKTIDDFKNFIKGERKKEYFNLTNNMNKFLNLIDPVIKDYNINLVLNYNGAIELNSYANELNQCLINIVNNSTDILKTIKDESKRNIFIDILVKNNNVKIIIKDSADGIPDEHINRIFEPYFTTKHKSKGTGLGLSMTYNIIKDSLKGNIEVSNVHFEYKNIHFKGAMFIITLPLL